MSFFRLITDFIKFFQPLIMLAFLFSATCICGTLLMAQMAIVQYLLNEKIIWKISVVIDHIDIFQIHHEISSTMLILLFAQGFYAFGLLFVICELCERVTQGFNEINDQLQEYNYLLFPKEIHRLMPIMVIFVQQPVDFKFFGSISCSRDSFKQVSLFDQFAFHLAIFLFH